MNGYQQCVFWGGVGKFVFFSVSCCHIFSFLRLLARPGVKRQGGGGRIVAQEKL